MLIDYLETANTSDSAGKFVVNWLLIDDNGNVIYRDSQITNFDNVVQCAECDLDFDDDSLYFAYNSAYLYDDGWEYDDEVRVCLNCLDRYYRYIGSDDVYLHYDVEWEEVN